MKKSFFPASKTCLFHQSFHSVLIRPGHCMQKTKQYSKKLQVSRCFSKRRFNTMQIPKSSDADTIFISDAIFYNQQKKEICSSRTESSFLQGYTLLELTSKIIKEFLYFPASRTCLILLSCLSVLIRPGPRSNRTKQ